MTIRVFGNIEGVEVGATFDNRDELSKAGVHRPTQAGISGSQSEGADAIVLSGGYEDDEDYGDEIIYTGHGGRDPNTGQQIAHQTLTRQNLALAKNQTLGLPVRVTRGHTHISSYSPETGYRYDGLFRVVDHWRGVGLSGFFVCRFRLVKVEAQGAASTTEPFESEWSLPERKETTILRVVRDTKAAKQVKEFYSFRCQVCNTRLNSPGGPYAEAAHIRPLGRPHNGPDVRENILCFCPNHHVLFDLGGFAIADDFSLVGLEGTLRINSEHNIAVDHIRYHRQHYGSG